MTPGLESTQLFKWLNKNNKRLAGRVLMVREEMEKWLSRIVQLFPHYPSHAVDHSDRIVAQLSNLLFKRTSPVVRFSAGEVYCLLCAAYLHDMGMVVAPAEQAAILASDVWKEFVGEGGGGHDLFLEYQALRAAPDQGNSEQAAFFAGIALRQLLADFVRRGHHERGKTTLEMHPFLKQLVDDGDSVAFETIADLGVGHGLPESELADPSRFPEERDVLGEKVNVRFLARLLRIGDLLDMDSKRADPMTARAIAPLSRGAVPHWQQYSAKKHENVTPSKIEFTFECHDQETHRILRDWFSWLESEVRVTELEQLHAARHDKWRAPRCIVSSQATPDEGDGKGKPTIIIKPAKGARYAFHDWKLELDHDLVLERLIYDVYEDTSVFVRELIQNALDATRCQMYVDFAAQYPGVALPERPTQFPEDFRERYPVVLSLTEEEVKSSPDTPPEKRLVFTIEDHGTGMNEQIITRYFLQIGRSYYQSKEFRERFKFAPTSRFGVGFLSVFAVSRNITVCTAKRDDAVGKVAGLCLTLREPRNYLLTESWTPFSDRPTGPKNGTHIRLVLDGWSDKTPLVELVREWCVAVEVPVVVREAGQETVIRAERIVDKTVLAVSEVDPEGRFILRAFDLDTHGVEGQIAVIAYEDNQGEGWCDCWSRNTGLDGEREDKLPEIVKGFTALHGMRLGRRRLYPSYERNQWIQQVDLRSPVREITVKRSMPRGFRVAIEMGIISNLEYNEAPSTAMRAVHEVARHVVEEHFAGSARAKGKRGAIYKGSVLSAAPLADDWRDKYPGTVVTWLSGRREDISVTQLIALDDLVVAAWPKSFSRREIVRPMKRHPKDVKSILPVVSFGDTPGFSDKRFREKIWGMNLCSLERQDDLWLFTFSNQRTNPDFERVHTKGCSWVVPALRDGEAGFDLDDLSYPGEHFSVLNREYEVVRWLYQLRAAARSKSPTVDSAAVEACWLTATQSWWYMSDIIAKWESDPRVPDELKPPKDSNGNLVPFRLPDLGGRSTVEGE